jgi:hypothetical protein
MIYVLLLLALALAALAFGLSELAQALGVAAMGMLLFALTRRELDSQQ